MNEMEHQLVDKTLESIHQLEMKLVEVQGDIRAMREHNDAQHESLSEKLDQSIRVDTHRLDTHSKELDNHMERLATLEEWKNQFETTIKNRITVSQSVATIAAVIVAYLLSKFL